MQGNKKDRTKVSKWREKSNSYSEDKRKLQARIRWMTRSRENWKRKYQEERTKNKRQAKELLGWKNKDSFTNKHKIKGHKYTADQISLCVNLRSSTNSSLRTCIQIIEVLSVLLSLEFFKPSISSIRNWEMKMGYHQLQKEDESSDEWVLIVDESILVGQQKLLLLMGVNLAKYNFTAPLKFSDTEVLGLYIGNCCTWVEIKKAIGGLRTRGYSFKYVVSDGGSNICKALKNSNIIRIEDCTHALGLLLKKRYKTNVEYNKFSKAASAFKSNISTSKYAAYMPPTQRSKARFLNLGLINKWSVKLLAICKDIKSKQGEQEVYRRIKWIEAHEDIINDISEHLQLLNGIFKLLKHKGLSEKTEQQAECLVEKSKVSLAIKESIREYLNNNRGRLKEDETLICCSDIIESKFGHFKNRMSSNKEVGFTAGCLTIANNKTIKKLDEVKTAMEEVKLDKISDWEEENLIDSLLKKKRKVFKSVT